MGQENKKTLKTGRVRESKAGEYGISGNIYGIGGKTLTTIIMARN